MRFCLHVALPLSVDVGLGTYVLELVESDPADGCWLRARDCDDPVVFLLARFPDRWEAGASLLTGFDVGFCPFHQRIMEQLVAEERASPVVRPVRPLLLNHRRTAAPVSRVFLELSHN